MPERKKSRQKYNPQKTRQRLLDAAFCEIHLRGFQAASLDQILKNAAVTKGALYHHFSSKTELGHAVVDEIIRSFVLDTWVQPLVHAERPLDTLLEIISQRQPCLDEVILGCPLNNLSQEMAPIEEGFQKRLNEVLSDWQVSLAQAIERAIDKGQVRSNTKPQVVACFVVSSFQGGISLAKTAQNPEVFLRAMAGLKCYLETLKI